MQCYNEKNMKKYVITGPSSCGKTTLISYFQGRGFAVIPELARAVLLDGVFHPSKSPFHFQQEIARRQAAEEQKIPMEKEGIVFLDRGFYDQIAYCWHTGVSILPPEIQTDAHYDGVFFLEMLPVFEKDGVRVESSADEAMSITGMFVEEYQKRNIPLVRVPVLSVSERAEYILKFIG